MYKNIFLRAGLTPTQASILEYLYQHKKDKASNIAKKIKKSRAIVYKDLEEMVDLKIVEKNDPPNQISEFSIGHPSQMEKFFDKKEKEIKKDRELFNNYLPDMVSSYNLLGGKPGVKFYEGKLGMEKILYDTLKSKTTIYTISDTKSVRKNVKEINEKYIQKRKKAKIKKKLIVPASVRDEFIKTKTEFTEIRFLEEGYYDFKSGMQIYDNKISYQTLSTDSMIGILIEDKNIYKMQKMLFEYIWNTLATSD